MRSRCQMSRPIRSFSLLTVSAHIRTKRANWQTIHRLALRLLKWTSKLKNYLKGKYLGFEDIYWREDSYQDHEATVLQWALRWR